MPRYILTSEDSEGNKRFIHSNPLATEIEFLERVPDEVLLNEDWSVHEVTRSSNKDEYIHSGHIDELVDDLIEDSE